MPENLDPIKILSALVDSNFKVIDPSASPPGIVVDVPNPPFAQPLLEQDYLAMSGLSNVATLNQFLGTYNKYTNGLPGDIRDFATDYANYLAANGFLPAPPNNEAAIKNAVKIIIDGFLKTFETATGFNNNTESSVIQSLYPGIATYGMGNSDDPDQYLMVNSFWKDFSLNYIYQPNGAIANSSSSNAFGFFQNIRSFTVVTATISNSFSLLVNNGSGGLVNAVNANTPRFEKTFYQYFPTLVQPDPLYDQTLKDFARNMITTYGYFSPSRQYVFWVSYLQEVTNTKAAPIASLPVQDVRILNDIFFLIVQMITSIQYVAASQADRLSLYTAWQRGYADLLNQVHVFTGSSQDKLRDFNSGNPFSDNPSLSDVQKKRQDEQGNFNAGMVQQITAYKDSVSEDSKALQSRVNQSSDAFNEQANTATAILQEISTILSAIYR